MDDKGKYLGAFESCLLSLADSAAEEVNHDRLLEQLKSLCQLFEDIQTARSGYWAPVEDSLLYLETILKSRFGKAAVYAGIQQLVCNSSLVLGAYEKGSKAVISEDRCRYIFPACTQSGPDRLTAFFVFDSAEVIKERSTCLNKLKAAGIDVTIIIQGGAAEDICLPEGISSFCLPCPRSLPALFDLVYYLCDTGLFLFAYDCLYGIQPIEAATGALVKDSRLAYVVLEKAVVDSDKVVLGYPEGSLSGVYRKSAVGKIGALDSLFTEERYLCEDYHIRTDVLDYASGTLSCTCDDVLSNHFPCGINRDGEALLIKHGRELKPKLDKSFIHEFFNHLCGGLQTYHSAALYHDGDDRMAVIMSGYLSESGMAEASNIRVMDVRDAHAKTRAELTVFCFPIYRHRTFDELLGMTLRNGTAVKTAFFDINYAAGGSLDMVLTDRTFEGNSVDAFTIYYRKSLRDMITGSGWNVSFSRVTRDVPGGVEQALRLMFPDSCDMMLRNLQTKFYAYVCSKL